jgi:hypothetical protein
MEKTLYLSESRRIRVRCDGPSLWVEEVGKAGRRVPVRLIRRVVIMGNVALDTGSLALFAARGVPVTLLNRVGEAVATLLGVEDGDRQRRARQEALQEDRERRERVLAWLSAWERGRQLVVVSRVNSALGFRWRREGYRRADYEAWASAVARAWGVPDRVRAFFRGVLHEVVAVEIIAGGWDPHQGVRHRAQPLGFVKDCAVALQADADRLWLDLTGQTGKALAPEDTAALAAQAEVGRPRLEALIRRLLGQYADILWEF